MYETPVDLRELPLRDYILPEAGSRSRLHGVRSRMPCRSWCLAVIIRESAAQLLLGSTEPHEMLGISWNFWIIGSKFLHQPLCGANPLHQIFSVPLGSSQIQRWQLSRGDKLEELEEEIRKQGGWEREKFSSTFCRCDDENHHQLAHFGPMIRFWDDGLWPNLQNSTNTDTLWLQLWLWQSLAESFFFFAICIGHAGSFQSNLVSSACNICNDI